jgi:hypothetical protein
MCRHGPASHGLSTVPGSPVWLWLGLASEAHDVPLYEGQCYCSALIDPHFTRLTMAQLPTQLSFSLLCPIKDSRPSLLLVPIPADALPGITHLYMAISVAMVRPRQCHWSPCHCRPVMLTCPAAPGHSHLTVPRQPSDRHHALTRTQPHMALWVAPRFSQSWTRQA